MVMKTRRKREVSAVAIIFAFAVGASVRADALARREEAYVQIREQHWVAAVALLDVLIDEDPEDLRLRMERGYARQALGQRTESADEFRLVARRPGEFQSQARAALDALETQAAAEHLAGAGDALLDQGYEELRNDRRPQAREKFEQALSADPGRTEVAKQLAYMSIADGRLLDAVKEFESERRLAPQDYEAAMELGYLYDSLHNEAGAERSFAAAQSSTDPKIRTAAADALENVRGRTRPLYLDVYASPYATTRFSDKIAFLELIGGYRPHPSGAFSVYAAARYTQDSRSRSGESPQIFADNYLSLAPGVRFQPWGWNASISAEWGATANLLTSSEHPRPWEANGRAVLADYVYWDGPHRSFVDAGGSAGYYSRYRGNFIGLVQLRAGFKVLSQGSGSATLYAPLNVYRDSNRDFYNNAVEAGVGFEIQPWTRANLKARVEYLRGAYMGIQGREVNPYGPHYDDVRVTFIYAGHFTKSPPHGAFKRTPRKGFVW
jgi:Flp pilus assembly protein TadD